MVKLSLLLLLSTPYLIQDVFADPLQDLCDKLRSLGLKTFSGYLAEVKKANTQTGQHFVSVLTTQDAGPLTLFAPTDLAWSRFKYDIKDPDKLASILSYHLVHGQFPLAIDDGKHDESFGAPPAGQVPPSQPGPAGNLPPSVPGAGGQPFSPSNQPGWTGNQPPITNQPGVGGSPGSGGQWPQGGQQRPWGQQPPNGGQPWSGGQAGDPNLGAPPVFSNNQNQNQGNSQQQSPQARDEPSTPNTQTQLALAGSPPIPYDTPNHVVIGRTTLYNQKYVMLEGTDRGQVVAWSNVTGADGKNRMLHQETDCPILKSTVWNNLVINVVSEVLYIPGSLPQLLGQAGFNAFKSMLKETTPPGMPYNMLDALDASNGWGAHGFTMFVVADDMMKKAKDMILSVAPNDPYAMATILQNHVINGTTIYSPTLCSAQYPFYAIASSGGPLTFFANGTGTFVSINHNNGRPMYMARILSTDFLAQNGVVHVVDSLLLSPFRDDRAAAMAYDQAAMMAGRQFVPEKGPVGIPSGPPPGPGFVMRNAANSKLYYIFCDGDLDLTRTVIVFSILMGIWFSTVPI